MVRKQQYQPMTLGGLDYHRVVAVLVTCMACDRQISVPSEVLIAKLGCGFPVPAVAKHTRCQQCGGRADESRPDWTGISCS
ncbi:MAG: hypothetical protein O7F75_05910 [Alphaproteobacteria bacterium]|nr:hypothetical protein [Alphaproteobacteria bacterium]